MAARSVRHRASISRSPRRNRADGLRRPRRNRVRWRRGSGYKGWSCAARRERCRPRACADWRVSRNRSRRLPFAPCRPPRSALRNLLYDITNLQTLQSSRRREAKMTKPKLPDLDDVVAIDIHTHAEEPCGMHGDDGYDDFQAQMAEYFKSPNKHPPTVPETAAYYRAKKIVAVIFPVDAERETGFRRYSNYEMLEVAA